MVSRVEEGEGAVRSLRAQLEQADAHRRALEARLSAAPAIPGVLAPVGMQMPDASLLLRTLQQQLAFKEQEVWLPLAPCTPVLLLFRRNEKGTEKQIFGRRPC